MTTDNNNVRGSHAGSSDEYQERYRRAVEEGKVKPRSASRGRHAAHAAEGADQASSSRVAANEDAVRRHREARLARQQQTAQDMNVDPRVLRAQQRAAQQASGQGQEVQQTQDFQRNPQGVQARRAARMQQAQQQRQAQQGQQSQQEQASWSSRRASQAQRAQQEQQQAAAQQEAAAQQAAAQRAQQRQAALAAQRRAQQGATQQPVRQQAPVASVNAASASATRANAAQSNANQAYIDQAYGADGSNQVQMPKKKKGRTWKIVLSVVLALLLVGGIGAGVFISGIAGKMKLPNAQDFMGILTDAKANQPFYVLVIGSDTWEDHGSRSDAMVLCRIDLKNAKVHMVSVPRDTPYMLNGKEQKLNEVFNQQGEAACVKAVSELTGVPISHYVRLEFDQLENVVNAIGGVNVKVPYSFDYVVYTNDQAPVHVDAGMQRLTGEQAIALARMRKAYNNLGISTDAVRQANVRAMMVGVVKQILALPVTEIPSQVSKLADMVSTDVSSSTIVQWAMDLSGRDVTMYSCTGPTKGGITESGLWLTDKAPEQWAKLMAVVDAGKDPEGVIDQEYTADEE